MGKAINVDNHDGEQLLINTELSGIAAYFQCRYKADVSLAKDTYKTDTVASYRTAFAVGSFQSGFALGIYFDDQYKEPVKPQNALYIGANLYANFAWPGASPTLKNKVNYYINNCHVSQNDMSIPIIRDSCFSTAVSATYLSRHKLVKESGRFYFQSFSMGRDIRTKENISCDVKLCVLSNKDSCAYARTDAKCPSDQPGYDYRVFGKLDKSNTHLTIWDEDKIFRNKISK